MNEGKMMLVTSKKRIDASDVILLRENITRASTAPQD